MDLHKLKTLINLVSESNITELEVTEGEEKVKIVKGGTSHIQPLTASHQAPVQANGTPIALEMPAPVPAATIIVPSMVAAPIAPPPPPVEGKIIKSPMVGTFYAAAGPDKPDFASIGTVVKATQTVCIIEAMKLLNEIEAGIDGTVLEVLVKNGTPVEFGQPLFMVA